MNIIQHRKVVAGFVVELILSGNIGAEDKDSMTSEEYTLRCQADTEVANAISKMYKLKD